MPLGTAPNDIFQNGKWYNRQGVPIGDQLIIGSNTPVGIAPSGTIAANGALTLGTALGKAYLGGIWLAFPAGAVFSGSAAGVYWCVMTTTTAGTVFNNTLAAGSVPVVPTAPVAVVDAGPGAYTGITTTMTNIAAFSVPGGSLGPNGQLRIATEFSYNTAAGTKTYAASLGGVALISAPRTTAGGHDSFTNRYRNLGVETRGSFNTTSESATSATLGNTNNTIDTTATQSFSLSLTTDTATNYIIAESTFLETLYAS